VVVIIVVIKRRKNGTVAPKKKKSGPERNVVAFENPIYSKPAEGIYDNDVLHNPSDGLYFEAPVFDQATDNKQNPVFDSTENLQGMYLVACVYG
jgi:hypothetical protein